MTVHPAGCDCGAYACNLRRKGVQISAAATIRSNSNRKPKPIKMPEGPSWEKGLALAHRNADGTVVPAINANGVPLRVKEYGENRAKYDELQKRARQGN